MRKLFIGLTAVLAISFASCNNEDDVFTPTGNNTNTQSEMKSFLYKGAVYTSTYSEGTDRLIFDDLTVQRVYNEIQKLPEVATLVNEDGSLEFYDTYDEMKTTKGLKDDEEMTEELQKEEDEMKLKYGRGQCTIWFHKSVNYSDKYPLLAADFFYYYNRSSMPAGWDNQVRSVRMINNGTKMFAKITFWEKPHYTGKSLTVMPIPNDGQVWLYNSFAIYDLYMKISSYKATFY